MKASQRSGWDDPCSCHNNAVKSCEDLLKQLQHIDKVMNAQNSEQILNNRLRVKTSIDVILEVLAKKVRNKIREDVGNSRFCIIVDEAPDESKREQMAIILRFVDVDDTLALTLKNEISAVLSRHCLDIQNIRRQGYDGASNMRGEWNGLQALFLKDCPYLALVAASREVVYVHQFFSNLNFIINVVGASLEKELTKLALSNEPVILVWVLIFILFAVYCECLKLLTRDANAAYKIITSFQFIFILHLMKEIMGITDVLCQVLQQKSQDILNAMNMLRNEGWENLFENVVSFSKKFDIDIPELSSRYIQGRELDNRFGEETTKLLTLSSALDPKDEYKSFNIDDICCLAEEYYPLDFSENEKINLRFQLKHFEVDVLSNPKFQDLRYIADLCRRLVETEKSKINYLIDRLICLIFTLPISTATSERAFSSIKIVKTRFRNKIDDEFLANNLVVYIEREIAKNFDLDSILDDFFCLKERKLQF
ncbi:hypothetical protein I3760_06G161100 [Carya illinoinensis]|nr:hypothetical protein I3760_06G161100 [Carya illinoinensis]